MLAGGRLLCLLAIVGIALSGCASSSIQDDATTFLDQHGAAATRLAAASRLVEAEVSRHPDLATARQLETLGRATAQARRQVVQAGEWNIASSGEGGEEGLEEEDLPRAETEITEAADELARAFSSLQTFVRRRSQPALSRYRTDLERGREQWDESISQLWHLAHRSAPPTV